MICCQDPCASLSCLVALCTGPRRARFDSERSSCSFATNSSGVGRAVTLRPLSPATSLACCAHMEDKARNGSDDASHSSPPVRVAATVPTQPVAHEGHGGQEVSVIGKRGRDASASHMRMAGSSGAGGAGAGARAADDVASPSKKPRQTRPRLHVSASQSGPFQPSPLARSSSSSKLNTTGGFGSRVCVRGDVVVASRQQEFRPGYVVFDGTGRIISVSSRCPSDVDPESILSAAVVTPGTQPAPQAASVETSVANLLHCTGFVDIHNHGVGGGDGKAADVVEYWADPSVTCRRVVQAGTTSVFATLTFPGGPGSKEEAQTQAVVDALELVVGKAFPGSAVLEGIHAEGPLVADLGGLPSSTYQVCFRARNLWMSISVLPCDVTRCVDHDCRRVRGLR